MRIDTIIRSIIIESNMHRSMEALRRHSMLQQAALITQMHQNSSVSTNIARPFAEGAQVVNPAIHAHAMSYNTCPQEMISSQKTDKQSSSAESAVSTEQSSECPPESLQMPNSPTKAARLSGINESATTNSPSLQYQQRQNIDAGRVEKTSMSPHDAADPSSFTENASSSSSSSSSKTLMSPTPSINHPFSTYPDYSTRLQLQFSQYASQSLQSASASSSFAPSPDQPVNIDQSGMQAIEVNSTNQSKVKKKKTNVASASCGAAPNIPKSDKSQVSSQGCSRAFIIHGKFHILEILKFSINIRCSFFFLFLDFKKMNL